MMEKNKSARGRAKHRRDIVNSEAEQGVYLGSIFQIDRFNQADSQRDKFSRALRENELNVHDLMEVLCNNSLSVTGENGDRKSTTKFSQNLSLNCDENQGAILQSRHPFLVPEETGNRQTLVKSGLFSHQPASARAFRRDRPAMNFGREILVSPCRVIPQRLQEFQDQFSVEWL